MTSDNGKIPSATEVVHLPRPSWAPAFFALGATFMVIGLYLYFMGPNWMYVVAGGLIAFAALAKMISGARRDYFKLPRQQEIRSATLPADSIRVPEDPAG